MGRPLSDDPMSTQGIALPRSIHHRLVRAWRAMGMREKYCVFLRRVVEVGLEDVERTMRLGPIDVIESKGPEVIMPGSNADHARFAPQRPVKGSRKATQVSYAAPDGITPLAPLPAHPVPATAPYVNPTPDELTPLDAGVVLPDPNELLRFVEAQVASPRPEEVRLEDFMPKPRS